MLIIEIAIGVVAAVLVLGAIGNVVAASSIDDNSHWGRSTNESWPEMRARLGITITDAQLERLNRSADAESALRRDRR